MDKDALLDKARTMIEEKGYADSEALAEKTHLPKFAVEKALESLGFHKEEDNKFVEEDK